MHSCMDSWICYFSFCSDHPSSSTYVGQTFAEKGMYKRHCTHRSDAKVGAGGLGKHYHDHHGGSVDTMVLTIIDSVKPGEHQQLDEKEVFWMHKLKTIDEMGCGGLNERNDLMRKDRVYCNCWFCTKK